MGKSPSGAKERPGRPGRFLSSLTGLVPIARHNPEMNRRAMVLSPSGLREGLAVMAQGMAEAPEFWNEVAQFVDGGELRIKRQWPEVAWAFTAVP